MPDTTSKPILLVVDDEEGPRASLKVVFKNDFEVLLASNGKDALKLARERTPDVAILDILMQGMSGVDVLRELKALDEDIEVIMLTAYETLETARQALRHGAREYLNKPFDIPTLRSATSKALEKRRATRELKSAHKRLEELHGEIARRTDADEVGNVLHDLNNPLTVINGFVELLERQVQSVASLEGAEMEKMRGNISRVHGQVARCLEISRRYLGTRRKTDPDERTSVNEVLLDLQELLIKHPSAEGHQFTISELEEPACAAIHSTDLLRILLNLAINALQSGTASHRVEVIAQLLPSDFDSSSFLDSANERFVGRDTLAKSGQHIAISVRDNGPGIPPEVVGKLFNEQFTTKPVGKGTGIGLGSVKQLVTQAKGAVRLSTKVGQGTTFTVFLPAR